MKPTKKPTQEQSLSKGWSKTLKGKVQFSFFKRMKNNLSKNMSVLELKGSKDLQLFSCVSN